MRITPLDLQQKRFPKSSKGVSEKEVNAFLLIVREEMEDLLHENAELRKDVKQLQKDLKQKEDFDRMIWGFIAQVSEIKARENLKTENRPIGG